MFTTTNLHFLPEDAVEMRNLASQFGERVLMPAAVDARKKKETPIHVLNAMREQNYFGISVPEEYGGMGFNYVTVGGIIEELSAADSGLSVVIPVHSSLFVDGLLLFGTEEQKKKYLPPAATGELIGANCITEPGAGTDVGSMKATAEDKGDHYLVNGTKQFITNATLAGAFIVFAKTDPGEGAKGISAFIIEKDFDGVSIGKPEDKFPMPASVTAEVIFTDVKVPKENVLGELNNGFKIAMAILNGGRIEMAFQAVGMAQRALNEALKYSRERVQFGKPINALQATQFKLANMATRVNAGRLMAYYAAGLRDKGLDYTSAAAQAKVFCSEMAHEVINTSLQIHGAYGLCSEYVISTLYADQRVTEIYEGTSEAQRLTIAGMLLREFNKFDPPQK